MKLRVSLPWLWEIVCLAFGLVLALSACRSPDAAREEVSIER